MSKQPVIVMDVDQVLLDYYSRLREYVNNKFSRRVDGLPEDWSMRTWLEFDTNEEVYAIIDEFSKSYEFGTLDAFPGADVVLHDLVKNGYKLICLTACGTSDMTVNLRKVNLFHRFGDIFEEIHFVNFTDSKADTLANIKSRYKIEAFIDDKPENIDDAYFAVGIENLILMKAPHNRAFRKSTNLAIKSAFSWYECKNIIFGD